MAYQAFRDAVREVLLTPGRALTWTEVRTTARLPQMYPNNKWVRRMEDDIRLMRIRDSNGILHWSLGASEETNGEISGTIAFADGFDERPDSEQGYLE